MPQTGPVPGCWLAKQKGKCPSWSVKGVVSVLPPGIWICYSEEQGGKRERESGERIRHKISKEILKDEDH